MRIHLCLCMLLGFAMISGTAGQVFAEEEPFSFGPVPAWHLMVGPTFGWSALSEQGSGGYIGGEVSLSKLSSGYWRGGYVDGLYDFGPGHGFFSLGPQFGWRFFGADAGVALRSTDWTAPGFQVRVLLSAGFVSLYGRGIYFSDDPMGQVGLMFKIPAWASGE